MELPVHLDVWHDSYAIKMQHLLVGGAYRYRTKCLECGVASVEFGPDALPDQVEISNLIQVSFTPTPTT